jgi:hypothetical protein
LNEDREVDEGPSDFNCCRRRPNTLAFLYNRESNQTTRTKKEVESLA